MSAVLSPSLRIRRPGWELRLAEVLEWARHRPYQLGQHDCVTVACAAVHALTGVELWEQWRGRYATSAEALKLCVDYGGGFTPAFSKLFQVEPSPVGLARRGDIAELRLPIEGAKHPSTAYAPHLVVINGRQAAGLKDEGVYWIARERCVHAWRIG